MEFEASLSASMEDFGFDDDGFGCDWAEEAFEKSKEKNPCEDGNDNEMCNNSSHHFRITAVSPSVSRHRRKKACATAMGNTYNDDQQHTPFDHEMSSKFGVPPPPPMPPSDDFEDDSVWGDMDDDFSVSVYRENSNATNDKKSVKSGSSSGKEFQSSGINASSNHGSVPIVVASSPAMGRSKHKRSLDYNNSTSSLTSMSASGTGIKSPNANSCTENSRRGMRSKVTQDINTVPDSTGGRRLKLSAALRRECGHLFDDGVKSVVSGSTLSTAPLSPASEAFASISVSMDLDASGFPVMPDMGENVAGPECSAPLNDKPRRRKSQSHRSRESASDIKSADEDEKQAKPSSFRSKGSSRKSTKTSRPRSASRGVRRKDGESNETEKKREVTRSRSNGRSNRDKDDTSRSRRRTSSVKPRRANVVDDDEKTRRSGVAGDNRESRGRGKSSDTASRQRARTPNGQRLLRMRGGSSKDPQICEEEARLEEVREATRLAEVRRQQEEAKLARLQAETRRLEAMTTVSGDYYENTFEASEGRSQRRSQRRLSMEGSSVRSERRSMEGSKRSERNAPSRSVTPTASAGAGGSMRMERRTLVNSSRSERTSSRLRGNVTSRPRAVRRESGDQASWEVWDRRKQDMENSHRAKRMVGDAQEPVQNNRGPIERPHSNDSIPPAFQALAGAKGNSSRQSKLKPLRKR